MYLYEVGGLLLPVVEDTLGQTGACLLLELGQQLLDKGQILWKVKGLQGNRLHVTALVEDLRPDMKQDISYPTYLT